MFFKHNYPMEEFLNRTNEQKKIESVFEKPSFGYITGRRRIGKTALLTHLCQKHKGFYHQATESVAPVQLEHLSQELGETFDLFKQITPKTWSEFFALLDKISLPKIFVLDEFPYLVASDPSLPSLLQKWIDHRLPKTKTLFLVSGSSQMMLYSQFLNQSSPLYGRSHLHLHLPPLSFNWFCKAHNLTPDEKSFSQYALLGGIPHYWKLLPKGSLLNQVDTLFFDPSSLLGEEAKNLLHDEGVTGNIPKAILDLVGQGVSKPSELAGRLGIPHGNLSRPLSVLLDLGILEREIPFGESMRTTKKTLYRIADPLLSFHYGVVIHQNKMWPVLSDKQKHELIHVAVSHQWEKYCRNFFPGSARYWDKNREIDLIAPLKEGKELLVGECKWMNLNTKEEENLMQKLKEKWNQTALSQTYSKVRFRVFSKKDISSMATGWL